MEFLWNVREYFPRDLTNTSTCSCKGQPQGNYKLRVLWVLEQGKNIKSSDKGKLHQCLKGVFFALYAWNAVPIDGIDIY